MEDLERELVAWCYLQHDADYRLERLVDYRATLYKRAEDLMQRGLVDWTEWFELKGLADAAYAHMVEEGV